MTDHTTDDDQLTSKRCSKCGEIKAREEFSRDRCKDDGRCTVCKECVSGYHRYRLAVKQGRDPGEWIRYRPVPPEEKPIPEEQTCTACQETKPTSEFYTRRLKSEHRVPVTQCIKCMREYSEKYRRSKGQKQFEPASCTEPKRCSKCGKVKSPDNFYHVKNHAGNLSLYSSCKSCVKKEREKPERRKYHRQYYHRKIKTSPDKMKRKRQLDNSNRTLKNRLTQKYKATKAGLPNTLTDEQWENIKAAYGYSCAYCGKAWHEIKGVLCQEHVIPVDQGGGYTADNIVPACKPCNSSKGPKTPEQAGMPLLPKVADR